MSITFLEKNKLFHIRMKESSYIFGVNASGYIQNIYWGRPIEAEDCEGELVSKTHSSFDIDINKEVEEYCFWTGSSYVEPCLKVESDNEKRKLQMVFKDWEIKRESDYEVLKIYMKDLEMSLSICMVYKVYYYRDIISRYIELTNEGEKNIRIDNLKSAAFHIPQLKDYQLTYTVGKWAGEYQLKRLNLEVGKFTMESKRGMTGPHFNPSYAIGEKTVTETHGNVWYGMLAWSGNWKIDCERTIFNHVRVVGGINDFDFEMTLKQGESVRTPEFIGGFTSKGYGEMSRNLHKYQYQYVIKSNKMRKVLYNSWEATAFSVEVNQQKALAQKAAEVGVELFVVDDGWFSTRNSDHSGLGDWYVDKRKFPNGLEELIDYVNSLGMEFGIWVEPESVNPQSELFKQHPDWIYHFEGIEPIQARNQYLLNLGNPEVKQYILQFMTKLLEENNIKFIKWDMNRAISDPGVAGGMKSHKELWYRHVESLYDIWRQLKEKFPDVSFETCSGGGARVDLGILKYAEESWPSDNTDPFDRLMIQEGFSYFYNPKIMMCWVTDSPNYLNNRQTSLEYRFHVAMTGSLGIGGDITKWSQQQLEETKGYIDKYKTIRHIIQQGEMYRLVSPSQEYIGALQYISEDKKEIVLFIFLQAQNFGNQMPRIGLEGLKEEMNYLVEDRLIKGSTLMNLGLQVDMRGDYQSQLVYIREAD